jgi:predicted alpha/beta superfamily hydrolase
MFKFLVAFIFATNLLQAQGLTKRFMCNKNTEIITGGMIISESQAFYENLKQFNTLLLQMNDIIEIEEINTTKSDTSTASKNVHIIDTAFFIPQLGRYRRVWLYLPESYKTSKNRYPVLYMHDGQNVFEEKTSFSGEWGVDEAIDTLGSEVGELIVVAIDNGGAKRMTEYNPYDHEKFGKGEGDAYVDFIVNTLRPYINKNYRTKRSSKYTYTAGSSMGGLISLHAILKYPNRFGGAGVFSPAFWVAPQIKDDVNKRAKKVKGKIYFFAGQQEGETMVPDMLSVFELFSTRSKAKLTSVIRSEGKHSESTWRNEFPLFYKWLFNYKAE